MKKKFIVIAVLAALGVPTAMAQDTCLWAARAYAIFDTHYGSRDYGGLAAMAERRFDNYTLGFGAEATSAARFALTLGGRADLGRGFCLENRYIYRQFALLNRQEFAGALLLGYTNRHWDFRLGFANRYTAELVQRANGGMGTVCEPMNLMFRIEGWLYEGSAQWNVGGRFSNMGDFFMERMTVWTYSLCGYYTLPSGTRLEGELGFHPVGSLNLTASYDGFYIHLGAARRF
ncbi:MAG: hypothetical protein IJ789_02915 [Bacteroidales bacterium]|nr:hypothetical protein [Bacteroidales bacterium]